MVSSTCTVNTHSFKITRGRRKRAQAGSLQTLKIQQGLLTQAQCQANATLLLPDPVGSAVLARSPSCSSLPSVKGAELGPALFSDAGALEMRCRYLTSLGPSGLVRSITVSALLTLSLLLCLVLFRLSF